MGGNKLYVCRLCDQQHVPIGNLPRFTRGRAA